MPEYITSVNPATNMIDEYHNPKYIKPTMNDLAEEEMKSQGLNPLNSDDVKKFWASKGIVNA
ncbi:hypothetical protein UFOVP245_143 [uncultured Caudovirales phage]|uniref:Uncharacterized protein n=1 Tax=uncultured Caudovirales phage TaxID=2100421 RepID=A0A6J7WTG6_9CAUD|nr:hypothetical protein UFOVP245_143 [uncultured Caudovirales phage]